MRCKRYQCATLRVLCVLHIRRSGMVLCFSLLCLLALFLSSPTITHIFLVHFTLKRLIKVSHWGGFVSAKKCRFIFSSMQWRMVFSFHQTHRIDNVASFRLTVFRSKQNLSIQSIFESDFDFGFRLSILIHLFHLSTHKQCRNKFFKLQIARLALVVQIGGACNAYVQLHTKLYVVRITVSHLFESTQMVYQTLLRFT